MKTVTIPISITKDSQGSGYGFRGSGRGGRGGGLLGFFLEEHF